MAGVSLSSAVESLSRGRPRTGQAGPGYRGDTDHTASVFRLPVAADPSSVEKDRGVERRLKDACPGPVRLALTAGLGALAGELGGLHPALCWGGQVLQCRPWALGGRGWRVAPSGVLREAPHPQPSERMWSPD